MDKLTPKQKAFADYYLELGNATESAKKAGYSSKTAKEMGCENLTKPHILAYMEGLQKKLDDNRVADSFEVLEFLTEGMRTGMLSPAQVRCAELLGKRYRLFVDRVEADVTQTVIFQGEDELEDDIED
jgi:phage terminase small subunit